MQDRISLVNVKCVIAVCLAMTWGLSAGPDVAASNRDALVTFMTNCPAVHNLVVELRFHDSPNVPMICQFRYQPGAFFAREVLRMEQVDQPITTNDNACGYWLDEYWAWCKFGRWANPAGQEPTLYIHKITDNRDWSMARQQCEVFQNIFGMFQSLGLSEWGINSVFVSNGVLMSVDPTRSITTRGEFILSNGLVVGATIQRQYGSLGELKLVAQYEYASDNGPTSCSLPKEIRLLQVIGGQLDPLWVMRIHRLEFADAGTQLSREMFFPETILSNPGAARQILRSNRTDYLVRAGFLTMIPDQISGAHRLVWPMQSTTGTRFLLASLVALNLVILTVILWRKLRKKRWLQKDIEGGAQQ